MNWLDTQTKEILQEEAEPKLAPPKTAEFALVLIHKGPRQGLIRAIRRINDCSEAEADKLVRKPTPNTISADLTQEEALFGQFELICCDAVGVFIRSEVLEQGDKSYVESLFRKVVKSPEFRAVRVAVREVPSTKSGEKFVDQFLGERPEGVKRPVVRFAGWVPFKKARIMKHWATRIGAQVECDALQEQ